MYVAVQDIECALRQTSEGWINTVLMHCRMSWVFPCIGHIMGEQLGSVPLPPLWTSIIDNNTVAVRFGLVITIFEDHASQRLGASYR